MGQANVNIKNIMRDIREEAVTKLRGIEGAALPLKERVDNSAPANSVLYSEELNYLNANWHNWNPATEITSHRKLVGGLIVWMKKALVNVVWNYILKGYFERERAFQMHLVKHLNATARYIDARDKEIFWQLVGKIDNEVKAVVERLDFLFGEASKSVASLENRFAGNFRGIQGQAAELGESITDLRTQLGSALSQVSSVKSFVAAQVPENRVQTVAASPNLETQGAWEAIILPSSSFIKADREELSKVVDVFASVGGVVLDIGCGEGELLELLKGNSIGAVGIDTNEALLACCRAKHLSVQNVDCFSYLESLGDATLGGVFAGRLFEQLGPGQLKTFLSLAATKIRNGGKLVIEGVNPESLVAVSEVCYRDISKPRPLHPDTASFVCETYGMSVDSVRRISSSPHAQALNLLEATPELPPRWNALIDSINENLRLLNSMLFGSRAYVITVTVKG